MHLRCTLCTFLRIQHPRRSAEAYLPPTHLLQVSLCSGWEVVGGSGSPPPTHLLQVYRLCSAASSPVLGELRAARRGPHGHSEPAQLLDAALR